MLVWLAASLVLAAGPAGPGKTPTGAPGRTLPPVHLADYTCSQSLELVPPPPERRPKQSRRTPDRAGQEAARGYLSAAVSALQSVPGPGQRNCVLDVVAVLQAALGDGAAVKRALDLVTPGQRRLTIPQVAETLGATGSAEAFRHVGPLEPSALPALAAAQARGGDLGAARRTLAALRDPGQRALALAAAGLAAVSAGHLEGRALLGQAAALSGTLPVPMERARHLSKVGLDQHRAGDVEPARRTLQTAVKIASDQVAVDKGQTLWHVSQALAEAGQLDEVARLPDLLAAPADRAELLGSVAAVVCVQDVSRCVRMYQRAVQLLAPAPAKDGRLPPEAAEAVAALLVPLAEAQIRIRQMAAARKNLERAQRLSLPLTGELAGGEIFPKLAIVQAQAGQVDAAVATARRSPTPAAALADVGRALSRAGRGRYAVRVLDLALNAVTPRSWHAPSDLLRIGQAQLAAQHRTALPATIRRALEAVSAQSDDSEQPPIRDIGALALLAGEPALVVAWAAKQSPYRRAQAMTGLALGGLWKADQLPPPTSWDLK